MFYGMFFVCTFAADYYRSIAKTMDTLREHIVKVAGEMFSRYGLRSVSVDDICKELSISKKTLYVHFKQKEDIVDAFLEQCGKEDTRKICAQLGKGNAIDDLLAFMRMIKIHSNTVKEFPAMVYDLKKYYPAVMDKHLRHRDERMTAGFTRNLQQGMKEGLYRPDLDIEMICAFVGINSPMDVFDKMQARVSSRRLSHGEMGAFFVDIIARYIMTDDG